MKYTKPNAMQISKQKEIWKYNKKHFPTKMFMLQIIFYINKKLLNSLLLLVALVVGCCIFAVLCEDLILCSSLYENYITYLLYYLYSRNISLYVCCFVFVFNSIHKKAQKHQTIKKKYREFIFVKYNIYFLCCFRLGY